MRGLAGLRVEDQLPVALARVRARLKSNRLPSVPAFASNDASPIRPVCQLSSTKRRIELWSVVEPSTKLRLAVAQPWSATAARTSAALSGARLPSGMTVMSSMPARVPWPRS